MHEMNGMKKWLCLLLAGVLSFSFTACGSSEQPSSSEPTEQPTQSESVSSAQPPVGAPEGFVFITGGSFQMGSPNEEAWRSADETRHEVTVSDFYISPYEVTQQEYEAVVGENPSHFSGENLPVENISWLDAVAYCNARRE